MKALHTIHLYPFVASRLFNDQHPLLSSARGQALAKQGVLRLSGAS